MSRQGLAVRMGAQSRGDMPLEGLPERRGTLLPPVEPDQSQSLRCGYLGN